jgi:putative hydrolases of HD superfamily
MSDIDDRLEKQLAFIRELDKLKSVKRRTFLLDGSRTENSAEHSWHISLMALLLMEHSDGVKLDVFRVIKILLAHDIVEIDAGDTYIYDEQAAATQEEREEAAARRLFALLPEDQEREMHALRRDYEEGASPEARFARAVDRFQPLYHNYLTRGRAWREHGVSSVPVKKINAKVREGSNRLGEFTERLIAESVASGYLQA